MATYIYKVVEYLMKDFPKIRDPKELKYIDLLDFYANAQIWEKKIREKIEFDKEHSFDIDKPTDAGHSGDN